MKMGNGKMGCIGCHVSSESIWYKALINVPKSHTHQYCCYQQSIHLNILTDKSQHKYHIIQNLSGLFAKPVNSIRAKIN